MTLFEEITQEINEELGISQLVTNTTNILINNIVKNSKSIPNNSIKQGCLKQYNLFGEKYDVFYTLYFFNTIKEKEEFSYIDAGNTTNNKEIHVIICYIKEINKYIDYKGSTQHELEHTYQIIKSGKYLLTPQNITTYTKAKNLITIGITNNNLFEALVGFTVYYNNRFEKDGYANDIYRQIIDNKFKNPIDIVKKTDTFNNILIIEKYLNNDSIYVKQVIDNIVSNTFGKHYKWWYNMAKNVVKNYKTKIGKIIVKAQKDLCQENTLTHIYGRIEENNFKTDDFLNDEQNTNNS